MFIEERLVFLRERGNGLYSVDSWMIANTLVSIPALCSPASVPQARNSYYYYCYFAVPLVAKPCRTICYTRHPSWNSARTN